MGRTTFIVHDLLPPLSSISERYNVLPAGSTLTVKISVPRAIFFLEGGLEMVADDRAAIPINAGDALLVRSPIPLLYRSRAPGRDARLHALVLTFDTLIFSALEDNPSTENRLAHALGKALIGVRHFPVNRSGNKLLLLRDVLAEMEQGGVKATWKISGICISILADLLPDINPPSRRDSSRGAAAKGAAAVDHVRLFMQEHLRDHLNLADLAWQVRLSPEHLSRLFKRYTSETVFEHLDKLRVNECKRLLVVSDLALGEIAEQCGYSSVNLLCRHFKQHTGSTPLAYRAKKNAVERSSPSDFSSSAAGRRARSGRRGE